MTGQLVEIINNIPITKEVVNPAQCFPQKKQNVYTAWDPFNLNEVLAFSSNLGAVQLRCSRESMYAKLSGYQFDGLIAFTQYLKLLFKSKVQIKNLSNTSVTYNLEKVVKHRDGTATIHLYSYNLIKTFSTPGRMDLAVTHITIDYSDCKFSTPLKRSKTYNVYNCIPMSVGTAKAKCSELFKKQ